MSAREELFELIIRFALQCNAISVRNCALVDFQFELQVPTSDKKRPQNKLYHHSESNVRYSQTFANSGHSGIGPVMAADNHFFDGWRRMAPTATLGWEADRQVSNECDEDADMTRTGRTTLQWYFPSSAGVLR